MRESSLNLALRNLRHLYEQMIGGQVRPTPEDIANAANGLLGPAIEKLEEVQSEVVRLETRVEDLEDEVIRLESEVADLDDEVFNLGCELSDRE